MWPHPAVLPLPGCQQDPLLTCPRFPPPSSPAAPSGGPPPTPVCYGPCAENAARQHGQSLLSFTGPPGTSPPPPPRPFCSRAWGRPSSLQLMRCQLPAAQGFRGPPGTFPLLPHCSAEPPVSAARPRTQMPWESVVQQKQHGTELPGLAAHRPVGTGRQESELGAGLRLPRSCSQTGGGLRPLLAGGPVWATALNRNTDWTQARKLHVLWPQHPRLLKAALDLPPMSLRPSSAAPPAAPGTHLHVSLTPCGLRGQPGPSAPTASTQQRQSRFLKNGPSGSHGQTGLSPDPADAQAGRGPAPQGRLRDINKGPLTKPTVGTPTRHTGTRGAAGKNPSLSFPKLCPKKLLPITPVGVTQR